MGIFDPTITLGSVLTLAGFTIGGIGFIWAIRRDVAILAARFIPLEAAMTRIVVLLEQVARQDERLKAVERDLERYDSRKKWRQPSPG